MTDITQQTLAAIVTGNHRSVAVLEKYQLDFCCKGKRTLAAACAEKGLALTTIAAELQSTGAQEAGRQMPFTDMSAEQLTGYIQTHHHFYVKQSMPVIAGHLEKVAMKHGDRYPYMAEVFHLFTELQEEMTAHMEQEETVVFPRINETERMFLAGRDTAALAGTIPESLSVLETEHEHAGDLMFKIHALTNNYTAPEGACTTFKVSLAELKEFEEDLHRHVHLENNILFPRAGAAGILELV